MHLEEFKSRILPIKARMFRMAMWLLQNREDAEDAVQEVFLKLWNNRKDLLKYDSMEALALKMIKNNCLNRIKLRRNPMEDIENEKYHLPVESPHNKLENANLLEIMNKVIESLPQQQKVIIQLASIEGLSMKEISDVTELSVNNVQVILSRARKSIRDTFKGIYGNG